MKNFSQTLQTFFLFTIFLLFKKSTQETVHSFKFIDFNFPTPEERQTYIEKEHYKNVAITGIKLSSNGTIFISCPRWKPNVPATLSIFNNETKKLEPFPTWEHQRLPQPNSTTTTEFTLRSVLGFEIDKEDRIWILDQGRVTNEIPKEGDIKLVIWDLKTNQLIKKYEFKNTETPFESSFLNDLAISIIKKEEKKEMVDYSVAYISDSGIPIKESDGFKPYILVYDFKSNSVLNAINKENNGTVRILEKHVSVMPELDSEGRPIWITVNGSKCFDNSPMQTGVNGIALSCDGRILYWTPLSRSLYSIETKYLPKNDQHQFKPENLDYKIEDKVVSLGNKRTASDGIVFGNDGKLYLSDIESGRIDSIDERKIRDFIIKNNTRVLLTDVLNTNLNESTTRVWPDTIAIHDGYLYFVNNNLCKFIQDKIDWGIDFNFQIHRLFINKNFKSYQNGCFQDQNTGGLFSDFIVELIFVLSISIVGFLVILSFIIIGLILTLKRRGNVERVESDDEKTDYGHE